MQKLTIELTELQIARIASALSLAVSSRKIQALEAEKNSMAQVHESIAKDYSNVLTEIAKQLEKQVPSVSNTGEPFRWYN